MWGMWDRYIVDVEMFVPWEESVARAVYIPRSLLHQFQGVFPRHE